MRRYAHYAYRFSVEPPFEILQARSSSSSVETSSGVGAVALAKAPSGARVPAFRLCLWLAGEGGAGGLDLRRRGSRTKGGALKRAFREPFEALLMSLRQLDSYFH